MAFKSIVAGDRFLVGDNFNVFPRKPKSGYTPVTGDLALNDITVDAGIDLIAADENPQWFVVKFENGIASAAALVPGTEIVLPYTGALVKGDKIEGSGTGHGTTLDRTIVRVDNTNGVGLVIAVDTETAYGTGHAVVRF